MQSNVRFLYADKTGDSVIAYKWNVKDFDGELVFVRKVNKFNLVDVSVSGNRNGVRPFKIKGIGVVEIRRFYCSNSSSDEYILSVVSSRQTNMKDNFFDDCAGKLALLHLAKFPEAEEVVTGTDSDVVVKMTNVTIDMHHRASAIVLSGALSEFNFYASSIANSAAPTILGAVSVIFYLISFSSRKSSYTFYTNIFLFKKYMNRHHPLSELY